ncbi:MAG TPA: DoxX family protein [Bacteroidota bacterium]|nr:DoxX family protein [Bacteroidota bacterium]
MDTSGKIRGTSKWIIWTGRLLSGLALLFMLFDSLTKVIKEPHVVQGTAQLGYPEALIPTIGFILLGCLILYAIPRTAILGAILLTGFLGGAVATNVRIENPLFSHTLFPVYVGILVWGGLYLRSDRLRSLLSLRRG